jgi:hypothetical protein
VAQGVDPEFKPQYHKKESKRLDLHHEIVFQSFDQYISSEDWETD